MKVSILGEQLQAVASGGSAANDIREDFEAARGLLEDGQPAYLLFFFDLEAAETDPKWLLIAFVPDDAKVRARGSAAMPPS